MSRAQTLPSHVMAAWRQCDGRNGGLQPMWRCDGSDWIVFWCSFGLYRVRRRDRQSVWGVHYDLASRTLNLRTRGPSSAHVRLRRAVSV